MFGTYDPSTQFSGGALYAVNGWMGDWKAAPMAMPIAPWWRPGDLTFVQPGAKLTTRISIPIHQAGMQGWSGKFEFDGTTGLFVSCQRSLWQKGTKANIFRLAEFDVGAFDMSPETMSIELGNNPGFMFAAMLNGAFSGAPKDKAGNPVANGDKVICLDQIYGPKTGGSLAVLPAASIPAWVTSTAYVTGQKVTSNSNAYICLGSATSGATAPTGTAATVSDGTVNWKYLFSASMQTAKPVNPADSSFQSASAWTNCLENKAINADNIIAAIVNQQQRLAMNGVELNLGDEGVEIWVPFASKEATRLLVEVLRQLPGTGTVPSSAAAQVPITGGTTSQVIFSVQDNPVFGRAKVVAITGMRSDMWCVVSPRPKPMPQYSLFIHTHGGSAGQYAIQTDPAALMADKVPHIAVYQWTQNSPLFFGGTSGTEAGDIGISMLLNEGFAFGSGLLIDVNFTGYAS